MNKCLWIALLMLLCICIQGVGYAEISSHDLLEFAYTNTKTMIFRNLSEYNVRNVYSIKLPDGRLDVSDAVVIEYGRFDHIYLVEYEYSDIKPIKQSEFFCVGIDTEMNATIVMTPFDIIGREFDSTIFDNCEIVLLDNL